MVAAIALEVVSPAYAQAAWAHQNGSLAPNGAVVLRSLGGGSYNGTQNPTGAVAKGNQSAATQPTTVVVQATGGISVPAMAQTAAIYNGNLGGFSGADAKCAAEFGTGWKFAEIGKLVSGISVTGGTGMSAWINNATYGSSCGNWTNSGGGLNGSYLSATGTPAMWVANGSQTCANPLRLVCVNY